MILLWKPEYNNDKVAYNSNRNLTLTKYTRRGNIADSAHFRETAKDAGAI